jgi:hypothetical protein
MRATKPLTVRFWAKVEKAGPDDCWLWAGATVPNGYGKISRGGSSGLLLAHRVSWILAKSEIPEGQLVLHRCDNRLCVNPAHLFLGTHGDNARDMVAKGRNWQSQVTHCRKGHEYTPANTYYHDGGRYCRTCNREAVSAVARDKVAAMRGEFL